MVFVESGWFCVCLRRAAFGLIVLLWLPPIVSAATLNVCASGCAYANLQPALDAAQPGDTILLRAGQTFVGNFLLPAKTASSTAFITIRSDASDSTLPGQSTRLVPEGKPGANASRSLLARIVGAGGTAKSLPVLRTSSGAHHYRLQFIDFDGAAQLGYETLIAVGTDKADASPPHHIVFDRVYVHGHATKGQKRGIALNGGAADVLNSYIADIKAADAESQAIAGWNGTGPYRIVNNYIEGAGENVMFGGGVPSTTGLIPSDIEISGNDISKQIAWRNPVLAPPGSVHAVPASTGSLAAGTHYFKVVAVLVSATAGLVSLPSAEVSATVTAGQGVTLSWTASAGAETYRIYHGTSVGGEAKYLATTGAATSFVYTGTGESAGHAPTAGTRWVSKNLLELKNAQRLTIDGNVFENNWIGDQPGYAIVLTPRNTDGKVPWSTVRDLTFTDNIVRHTAGGFNILGFDDTQPAGSQQTQRITIRNNLFYDIDPSRWGGGLTKCFLLGQAASDVVFDHNTIDQQTTTVLAAYGQPTVRFAFTNNIALLGQYGVMGDGSSPGNPTLAKYFPNAVFTYNALAGGTASLYPATNSFPTVAQWNASFVDAASGDYRLLSSSTFYHAGSSGTIPGVDMAMLDSAGQIPAPPSALRIVRGL